MQIETIRHGDIVEHTFEGKRILSVVLEERLIDEEGNFVCYQREIQDPIIHENVMEISLS